VPVEWVLGVMMVVVQVGVVRVDGTRLHDLRQKVRRDWKRG
jgi:hypothetical protein